MVDSDEPEVPDHVHADRAHRPGEICLGGTDRLGRSRRDSFELSDERVLPLSDGSAVVAYRAKARRGGTSYDALLNSTYVRENGSWRLALHQQTPV
ncbi:MAG: DUF4440 domain-containing protein [Acidimicrobiia bacterium]